MLSKKMAFSLTSLITIFALAFVVPSAMADNNINSVLIMDDDVSHAGGLQLRHPGAPADADNAAATIAASYLRFTLRFDKPVDLTAAKLSISVFDADGNFVATPAVEATAAEITTLQGASPSGDTDDNPEFTIAAGTDRRDWVVTLDDDVGADARTVKVRVAEGVASSDAFEDNATKKVDHTVTFLGANDTLKDPDVLKIALVGEPFAPITTATFQIHVLLSEEPKEALKDIIDVSAGAAYKSDVKLASPPDAMTAVAMGLIARPAANNGGTAETLADNAMALASWRDRKLHLYLVTLDAKLPNDGDVDIKIKNFTGMEIPSGNLDQETYVRKSEDMLTAGRDILTVKVTRKVAETDQLAGVRVSLPKDVVIPAGGYLVVTKNSAGSEVVVPADSPKAPKTTNRTRAQRLYNVQERDGLPNLATALRNGVLIDLESQDAGLIISEVMWGEDVSLNPISNSQWIELHNSGATAITTKDDDPATAAVNEAITLVFYGVNELSDITAKTAATGTTPAALPAGVTDRIGTLGDNGAYWNPEGTGQSGASGTPIEKTTDAGGVELIPTVAPGDATPIVSMYRVIADDGEVSDGQVKAGWKASVRPSTNFDPNAIGIRVGTPGAATSDVETAADLEAEQKEKDAQEEKDAEKIRTTGTYPMAGDGLVYISEIMFAGGGPLPQWIEIANADLAKAYNLSGWTLTVDNATADADVSVGATAMFTIPDGTMIAPSKVHDPTGDNMPSTILIVTESGRNSFTRANEAAQVINLAVDNEVELIAANVLERRYTLLSDMAFQITLAPPVPEAVTPPAKETAAAKTKRLSDAKKEANLRKAATDIVGNLGADGAAMWALPTNEGGPRSSIIRKHVPVARGPKAPEEEGMVMENWSLAADTGFGDATHGSINESYYGARNDIGTPGFRAGGALPVELSHFRPVRDKATGQVVITWSTESELNNAGFFVKRSNQRDGEFQVINAAMVAGAGTTSEKQFYTYTDTTAQPNVVYYYQIEDVSFDGNRQTLTRGIRLRGHVGAAGKLTSTWGELKTSNE